MSAVLAAWGVQCCMTSGCVVVLLSVRLIDKYTVLEDWAGFHQSLSQRACALTWRCCGAYVAASVAVASVTAQLWLVTPGIVASLRFIMTV